MLFVLCMEDRPPGSIQRVRFASHGAKLDAGNPNSEIQNKDNMSYSCAYVTK